MPEVGREQRQLRSTSAPARCQPSSVRTAKYASDRAGAVAPASRGPRARPGGSAPGTPDGRSCFGSRCPPVVREERRRSRAAGETGRAAGVLAQRMTVVLGCSGTSRCLLCLAHGRAATPSSRSTCWRSSPSASPSRRPVLAISPISVSMRRRRERRRQPSRAAAINARSPLPSRCAAPPARRGPAADPSRGFRSPGSIVAR